MQGVRLLTWSTLQKSRSQPVMGSSRLSEMVAFLARRQDRESVFCGVRPRQREVCPRRAKRNEVCKARWRTEVEGGI
jgi:hypothetical protein